MPNGILRKTLMAPSTESANAYANDFTGAGPVTLLINQAPDGLAHKLMFVTTTDESSIVATITGTDADGHAQVEAHTLPNNTTNYTAKYFKTVTSITLSATIGADTMDIGYADEVVSESLSLNWESAIGAKFFLDVVGTLNVDVQFTIADPEHFKEQNANLWVEPYATLTAETADSTAVVAADPGYAYYRIQFNSYSAGAAVKLYVAQPR
jgi:hypothetical protein